MLHLHNPNYLYTFTTPPFVYLQQPPTDRRGVNKIPGTTNSTHGQITISIFRSLAGGEPFYLNKHNTCFLHSNGGRYVIRNYSALFKDDFRFLRGCPSDEPFSCMVTLLSWLRNAFSGGIRYAVSHGFKLTGLERWEMTKFILLTERRPSRLTQSTSDIEAWDDKMPALSQLLPPSKSANLV
jgi:hypothetical protein